MGRAEGEHNDLFNNFGLRRLSIFPSNGRSVQDVSVNLHDDIHFYLLTSSLFHAQSAQAVSILIRSRPFAFLLASFVRLCVFVLNPFSLIV